MPNLRAGDTAGYSNVKNKLWVQGVCVCVCLCMFVRFSSYVIQILAVYPFLVRDFLTLNRSEEIDIYFNF
jgi:hypothetical protein